MPAAPEPGTQFYFFLQICKQLLKKYDISGSQVDLLTLQIRNLGFFTCPESTWMPAAPEPGGLFEKFQILWMLHHYSIL